MQLQKKNCHNIECFVKTSLERLRVLKHKPDEIAGNECSSASNDKETMVSTAVALTSGFGSFKSFIRIFTAKMPTSGLEYFSLQQIKASQALLLILEL